LPTRNIRHADPFLLVHHLPPTELRAAEGRIPPHPHAGFEVMTYLLQGSFFHRDSRGHDQVAGPGDLNWMSAGTGIIHSEGPSEEFLERGGKAELLQIWINVPAPYKQAEAAFSHFPSNIFPRVEAEGSEIKIILGSLGDRVSPVPTRSPMFLYLIKMQPGIIQTLPVGLRDQAGIYVLDGRLRSLNAEIKKGQMALFHQDGDQVVFEALQQTELILFGGEPMGEKIVHYGPFVMNSLEEIQQKIREYETGTMGALEY
jgi:quercetin 2,3-dioxygenase